MEIYLARQPIFNRTKTIVGYELLFRDSLSNSFPEIDGNTASSNVLSNTFLSMGIDKITGGKKAFVNFTQDLVIRQIPLLFPKEILVVELLETIVPTDEVVLACQETVKAGYQLAMDDFIYDLSLESLIALAGIIKFDIRQTPLSDIPGIIKKLSVHSIKFLAEKVETYEEYEDCLKMGFDFFQGYFFSKPQVMQSKDISPSRISLLQIMSEINRAEINLTTVGNMISRDVTISFKLLSYINSAYFFRGRAISTIQQAVLRLGDEGIRRFIPIIFMSSFSDTKPHELIRASVIRARFCELLGNNVRTKLKGVELFTLGLFSMIDAIMDEPIEQVIKKISFSTTIRNALLSDTGEMAPFLNLVRSYERGDWADVSRCAEIIGIEDDRIPELYMDALVWSDTMDSAA